MKRIVWHDDSKIYFTTTAQILKCVQNINLTLDVYHDFEVTARWHLHFGHPFQHRLGYHNHYTDYPAECGCLQNPG